MENGFSSPRSDVFPAGLRVLVVDDDPTWLKLLEKMLKKCSYEVTTCGLATDALRLLRERKDGFDIVISDVNMPDMDGFKLLEHVGLEMDLPVIMMSVDGETSRVMKGVQHGACDYLLKPIRMKELKNIWQHVFRKKIHEIRDIENHDCLDGLVLSSARTGPDPLPDEAHLLGLEDLTSARKRKDSDNNRHDNDRDYNNNDSANSAKKARVVWSVDLHQKFVKAVNQIGFDKVGPKKILDLMNVPWLTRENVASHLQKYRLYLSRLQKEKENESKPLFGGIKSSDVPPKEPPGGFRFPASNSYSSGLEDDLKAIVSEPPVVDSQAAAKKSSQIGLDHSFGGPKYNPWAREASKIQFGQEHKPVLHLENSFTKLPLPDPIQSSITSISSKPSTASEIDSFPIPAKANNQPLELIYTSTSSATTAQALNNCAVDFGAVPSLAAFGDDFQFLFQGGYGCDLLGVCNAGFSDCVDDQMLGYDYYDAMRLGYEYPYDPAEYAMIEQSLLT